VIVIDGKGWSLKSIMVEEKWKGFTMAQLHDLHEQLGNAAVNASMPARRERYGKWAVQIESLLMSKVLEEADLGAAQVHLVQPEEPQLPAHGTY